MIINLQCPACQNMLTAKVETADRQIACPSCGEVVVVPGFTPIPKPAAGNDALAPFLVPGRRVSRGGHSSVPLKDRIVSWWYVVAGIAAVCVLAALFFVFARSSRERAPDEPKPAPTDSAKSDIPRATSIPGKTDGGPSSPSEKATIADSVVQDTGGGQTVPQKAKVVELELPETARVAFILVRRAELRPSPSFDSKELASLPFALRLAVLKKEDDWVNVSASVDGQMQTGYVHVSQVTGNSAAIDALQQVGLLPRRLLCSQPGDAESPTLRQIGDSVPVRRSKAKDSTVVQQMLFEPGDGVWFASESDVKHVKGTAFKSIGARPVSGPLRPRTVYSLTHTMELVPLGQALAEALAEPDREIPGVLAFKAPARLCPKPVDALWLDNGELLLVADAERGLIIMEVDPLHHSWQLQEPMNSPGEVPTCLITHARMIVAGWKGSTGRLRGYELSAEGSKETTAIDLPDPPITLAGYGKKDAQRLLVGTEQGHLLVVDFAKKRIVTDKKVFETPLRQLLVDGEQVWAAGGSAGLRAFRIGADDALQEVATPSCPVDRIVLTKENKKHGLLLFSESAGVAWLPCDNFEKRAPTSLPGCEQIKSSDAAEYSPPNGSMNFHGQEPAYVLAAVGKDGIHMLRGSVPTQVTPSQFLKVPCEKVVWGVDMAAVLSARGLWFISLSELLPPDFRQSAMSVAGGARIDFSGGNLRLLAAKAFGSAVMKGKDVLEDHPNVYQDEDLRNRITLIESDNSTVLLGWWRLAYDKPYYFGPRTQISVGKTGATVKAVHYSAGEIIELGDDGKVTCVGRWPGTGGSRSR